MLGVTVLVLLTLFLSASSGSACQDAASTAQPCAAGAKGESVPHGGLLLLFFLPVIRSRYNSPQPAGSGVCQLGPQLHCRDLPGLCDAESGVGDVQTQHKSLFPGGSVSHLGFSREFS